jgi:hypothetical protein
MWSVPFAFVKKGGSGWGQVLQYDNLDDMRIAWHVRFALNSLEPSTI